VFVVKLNVFRGVLNAVKMVYRFISPFFSFLFIFYRVQNDPANCLFLKFEELQANPFRTVKQVSMFLELPMTSVELKSVVAQTVLQEMRNSVHAGGVYNDRSGTSIVFCMYGSFGILYRFVF
jgi:hypothetical protein